MDTKTFNKIKEESIEKVIEKYLGHEADLNEKIAMKKFLEELLNQFMYSERGIFLDKDYNNKGNGYYPRDLNSGSFNLNLSVPRDRFGNFRPSALPDPYKRVDENYIDLLMSLVVNGYSESQMMRTLKNLKLPYSEDELVKIREDLIEKLNDFKSRQLPEKMFALFIDAYHSNVKKDGKVQESCTYIILAIDLEGKKDIYGLYTIFGSETKGNWLKIFNDLISRGLKKVCIIVSDDFPGVDDAIKSLFPKTDHQLCYVHLQRNIRKNMGKTDASFFNKELTAIRFCKDFDEGVSRFEKLCDKYSKEYPTYIKELLKKQNNYLCFLNYPEEIRKYIYTTNVVENINSNVERNRINLGGHFQSVQILELNLFLHIQRLKMKKWKKPIPKLTSCIYEMNQIFNLKFYDQTHNS